MADDKILDTTKALLGLDSDPDPFDVELLVHINSAIANLNQLGVGPREGLVIEADTPWSALLSDDLTFENAKQYIFMKVKMVFDSANMTAHLISAYEKMIQEQEWRLTVQSDPLIPQLVPPVDEDV